MRKLALVMVAFVAGCSVESVTGSGDEVAAAGFCGYPSEGFLFRSTDAGATFSKIDVGALQGFSVATRGGVTYVAGYDAQSNDKLLRTTDGATFVDVEPTPRIQPATTSGLWADSANELWAADAGFHHGLAHTTDGGATWTLDIATTGLMYQVVAVGQHDLFAVGYTVVANSEQAVFLHGTR